MKKEKHIVNKTYSNHQLSRYIDVYEVSANRCHSVPESGYKGTEATLVDEPAWNEKFSSYSITGATLTGNNFILNNDVTAKANYETAKNVTTIRCNSTKNSGFIGDTASLTNASPAWNEKFNSYSITGSTLTGSNFRFTGSDITAQANFETAKNVTLQTDGHGSIASTKSSGFINDTAILSNTASNGYGFSGYSITGATLTGSNFTFTGSDITAKAWFSALPTSALYWSDAGSNVAKIGTNIVKNVNKPVTAFNYFTVKFSLKVIWDSYYYYGAGHFYMNFDKGSWYILNHEGYPTNGYAGIRSERNTGEKFYPTTAAYSRVYPKNSKVYTYYASKQITTQVNYKYVIDRSNARCSAVLDNVYMGYGNTSANITAINSLTGSYGGSTASTGKMTASNYSIAGFSNLSDALNY